MLPLRDTRYRVQGTSLSYFLQQQVNPHLSQIKKLNLKIREFYFCFHHNSIAFLTLGDFALITRDQLDKDDKMLPIEAQIE